MKFSINDFFNKYDQITFTEEILNGKLHFLCSEKSIKALFYQVYKSADFNFYLVFYRNNRVCYIQSVYCQILLFFTFADLIGRNKNRNDSKPLTFTTKSSILNILDESFNLVIEINNLFWQHISYYHAVIM